MPSPDVQADPAALFDRHMEHAVSAEIVNLSKVRKVKARAERERTAEANRARFGRSKVERQAATLDSDRARRELDGALRQTPDSDAEQK